MTTTTFDTHEVYQTIKEAGLTDQLSYCTTSGL